MDIDPIDAVERNYGPEQAEKIVRASLLLSEAYFTWAFEPRTSLKLGILGDCIQSRFREYLEQAHPDEFRILKLAEKGFALPRVTIES